MTDIYLDCANIESIKEAVANPLVKGVTTNPSICRAAGVTDYEAFCKAALKAVDCIPISFEVFSDDLIEMERQARKIASWGDNIYVKIPVSNTHGDSTSMVVKNLSDDGIRVNVTAVFSVIQVNWQEGKFLHEINSKTGAIISVFAGRIADTGINPKDEIHDFVRMVKTRPDIKILWASPRQVLDIYQAEKHGCHIITVTPDLLKKYEQLKGRDLTEFSLSTVKMFYDDALKANYQL